MSKVAPAVRTGSVWSTCRAIARLGGRGAYGESRGIVADFLRGLTVVGLARKYGRTRLQVEAVLRRAM